MSLQSSFRDRIRARKLANENHAPSEPQGNIQGLTKSSKLRDRIARLKKDSAKPKSLHGLVSQKKPPANQFQSRIVEHSQTKARPQLKFKVPAARMPEKLHFEDIQKTERKQEPEDVPQEDECDPPHEDLLPQTHYNPYTNGFAIDPEDLIQTKMLLNSESSAKSIENENQDSKQPALYVEMMSGAWRKMGENYDSPKDAAVSSTEYRPVYEILGNLFVHEVELVLILITGLATGALLHPLILSYSSSNSATFFQGYSPVCGIIETLITVTTLFLPVYALFILSTFRNPAVQPMLQNGRVTIGILITASVSAFLCCRNCEALGESMRYRYIKDETWWTTDAEDYETALSDKFAHWRSWNVIRFASCFISLLCLLKLSGMNNEHLLQKITRSI